MNMRTIRLAVAILTIAGMALGAEAASSPAKQAQIAPRPPVAAAKSQKSAAQPDTAIEAAIRAKFAKSKIAEDKFQVRVQGGVATIEGRTDVIQHKGVATRLAKTGGAVAVNNHIQTSDAAKQKAAANLEQGRRRAQIKRGDARSEAPQQR
jgi:hypothetical protein